ncbi:MAG: T9SS type A sorting domain-containing protein [Ignavibacteria bacterium]|nr:T9SS type A sorting domain-containing protein [Ignavibacteria bacterium]
MKYLIVYLLLQSLTIITLRSQCLTLSSQRIESKAIPYNVEVNNLLHIVPLVLENNFSANPPRRFYVFIDDIPVTISEYNQSKVSFIVPPTFSKGMHTVKVCVEDGRWTEATINIIDLIIHDSVPLSDEPDPQKQYGSKKPDYSEIPLVRIPGQKVENPSGGWNNVPNQDCDKLHKQDGAFTGDVYNKKNEWSDIIPLKGRFSYLYLDYCQQSGILYLLNDWVLGNSNYDSNSCYNLFKFSTGDGREKWEIRVFHSIVKGIIVLRNSIDVTRDTNYVLGGGYGFSPSPNDTTPHTIYEFAIKAETGVFYMPVQDDPYRPAEGPSTFTICDDNGRKGWGLVREPNFYTAVLDNKGTSIFQYKRYITPQGIEGLEVEPNIIRGNSYGDSIEYDIDGRIGKTQKCNNVIEIDGNFSSGEWDGWIPASGQYSDLYAKFCDGKLHILNDWVLATEEPSKSTCYNLFELYTGNGTEQWGIYVYHDKNKGIKVFRNGIDVSSDSLFVQDGVYGWNKSPRLNSEHTIYEFVINAKEGGWLLFLADPGPRSSCSGNITIVDENKTDVENLDIIYKSNIPTNEVVFEITNSNTIYSLNVEVYNQQGVVIDVFQNSFLAPQKNIVLPITTEKYSSGVYLLKLTLPNKIICKTFFVIK